MEWPNEVNTRMGNTDTAMVDHLFFDMPSSVALEIVEIQMQSATGDVRQFLSVPAGQGNDHVVDKVSL
jgi:hypothetical protein